MKLLMTIVVSCLLNTTSYTQLLTKDFNTEEKIAGLSKFWSEAKYSFANFRNVPSLNWDSAYQSFIPRVLNTKTGYEYYKVLKQFCSLLNDGHTDILSGFGFYYDTLCTPPVIVKNFNHKPFIVWVADSLKNILPAGSEIVGIDGKPANSFINDEIMPYISEGTTDSKWAMAMLRLLEGIINTAVSLTIQPPGGKKLNITLTRNYKHNRVRELDENKQTISFKWLDNKIALLHINTFSNSKLDSSFTALLPQLYKAKAVIIDIRENTGGSDENAVAVIKQFTSADSIKGCAVSSRQHVGSYKAWARNNTKYTAYLKNNAFIDLGNMAYSNTVSKKITAPLVVLTDVRTRSAAEDFLVMLDVLNRAVRIGETTGGSTGQPLFFKLAGQLSGCVCTIKNTFPDGREFVGKGIKPHIEVANRIEDFLQGKDRVMEKAIEFLEQKIQ